MNVTCTNCPAKYAIPDDKVRGKKVRIKCKRCNTPIIVDGTKLGAGGIAVAAPRPAKKTMVGGIAGPAPGANAPSADIGPPRAQNKTMAGGIAGPAQAAPRPEPEPPPPPPPEEEPELWTVAVTEDDQREASLDQVVAMYADGTIDHETFLWKDGMDDWLTAFEIPEISQALSARGIGAPDDDQEESTVVASNPLSAEPPDAGGMWHEPGSWEPPPASEPEDDDGPNFDDVTVAMAAPQTEELLRQSGSFGTSSGKIEAAPAEPDPEPPPPQPRGGLFDSPETDDDFGDGPPSPGGGGLSFDVGGAAAEPRPTAARRETARAGVDLFGGEEDAMEDSAPSQATAPSSEKLTGARNESSVLFSLDSLTKGMAAAPAAPAAKLDENVLLGSSARASDAPPNSVSKLGGGGMFATQLAAPDLSAPAPEPSVPPPAAASASVASIHEEPEKSGGKGFLIGVLVLLLVAGAGGGAYVYMNWPLGGTPAEETGTTDAPAQPTAPTSEPSEETSAADTTDTPSDDDSSEAEPEKAEPETATPKPEAVAAKKGVAKTPAKPAKPAEKAAKPATPAAPEKKEEKEDKPEPAADLPPFDRGAAAAALGAAAGSAASCRSPDGPTGSGRVTVTFAPSGRATNAIVGGAFSGTSVGGCIARIFRGARVPKFSGGPVTVGKTVRIQ